VTATQTGITHILGRMMPTKKIAAYNPPRAFGRKQ
jgi:hypothetical protein